MAKKKKKSPVVSAIHREIAAFQKKKGAAKEPAERQKVGTKIKLLKSVARLIDDFYGDTNA